VGHENVELVLRGYWAFVAGDLATVAEMLDPEVEWSSFETDGSDSHEEVLSILGQRFADGYRVELERCVAVGDQVAVAFRASGVERDEADDRPLQTRRYFTIGRYSGVVTIRDGRVVRVRDYPSYAAALEAIGLDEDGHY
jgi:ketosteroid isomerase-like protein